MQIDKNNFCTTLRKYKILIKIYKKSQARYQKCALALFKKNSSYYTYKPNRNQNNSGNGLQNGTSYKILP